MTAYTTYRVRSCDVCSLAESDLPRATIPGRCGRARRLSVLLIPAFAALLAQAFVAAPVFAATQDAGVDPHLIAQAYDYAYASFAMAEFRWNALDERGNRTSTTLNSFVHQRAMTAPADTWASSPLVDCLYSTAWLDLSAGPVTINTPNTHDRYYVLTLNDYYSNTFFYAGTRTTGTAQQKYIVVGPDWRGPSPEDMKVVRSPTNDVYINLRVAIDGPRDQAAANAVQDGFLLRQQQTGPSHRPRPIKPIPGDPIKPTPGDLVNFLTVANQGIAINPPPGYDADLIRRIRTVGICGANCSWEKLPENVRQAWRDSFERLTHQFDQSVDRPSTGRPGWINYSAWKMGGTYHNYQQRASELAHGLAMLGLAPAEAVYASAAYGSDGQALVGAKKYRMHIPPGGIPSNAFWSITLYKFRQGSVFLNSNSINRYRISSHSPGYVRNSDGSIDVWIQAARPIGDKAANWLPSPAGGGRFWFIARSYWPKAEVLDGKFRFPTIEMIQ